MELFPKQTSFRDTKQVLTKHRKTEIAFCIRSDCGLKQNINKREKKIEDSAPESNFYYQMKIKHIISSSMQ